jgi:hypothetical protein
VERMVWRRGWFGRAISLMWRMVWWDLEWWDWWEGSFDGGDGLVGRVFVLDFGRPSISGSI